MFGSFGGARGRGWSCGNDARDAPSSCSTFPPAFLTREALALCKLELSKAGGSDLLVVSCVENNLRLNNG